MRIFNASPTATALRADAYADEYVELRQTSTVRAIFVPQGAELHQDDGSIDAVKPGGWVVEHPLGHLYGAESNVIGEHYEVADGDNDDWQRAHDRTEVSAAVDAHPAVPFADELREAVFGAAIETEDSEVAGSEPTTDVPGETKKHNAQLQREFLQAAEAARDQLVKLAQQAVAAQLITTPEAAEWVRSGQAPEQVRIVEAEDGFKVVSRDADDVQAIDPGNEKLISEGRPAGSDENTRYDELSHRDRQKAAKELGLEADGTKEQLLARLREHELAQRHEG